MLLFVCCCLLVVFFIYFCSLLVVICLLLFVRCSFLLFVVCCCLFPHVHVASPVGVQTFSQHHPQTRVLLRYEASPPTASEELIN